jgi:hypothetical protein
LSKAASHLLDSSGSHPEWTGLIDFYKVKIAAYKGDAYKMFLLGYLSHIIADHLWARYKREISGSVWQFLKLKGEYIDIQMFYILKSDHFRNEHISNSCH